MSPRRSGRTSIKPKTEEHNDQQDQEVEVLDEEQEQIGNKRKARNNDVDDDDNNDVVAGGVESEAEKDVSQTQTTATTSLIGSTISKKFGSQMYDGKVISGPFDALNETSGEIEENWLVRYTDGDEEDMNLEEIKKWTVVVGNERGAKKSSSRGKRSPKKKKMARKTVAADDGNKKDQDGSDPQPSSGSGPKKRKRAQTKKKDDGDEDNAGGGDDDDDDDFRPGKKKKNRFRGKLEDRTCPLCQQTFTSTLGKKYHFGKFAGSFCMLLYLDTSTV
jgi:hypothetical protein